MGALTPTVEKFLDEQIVGVLATAAPERRPRQSVVYYVRQGEELLISTLATRRKALHVQQAGWASLCVSGHERPFPAATISGAAVIRTKDIGPPTALLAQRFLGLQEPPEPQTDEALAEIGRVILAIAIERVAAVNYLEG